MMRHFTIHEDSVHFLARADPRDPGQSSRACSAAKAMGYMASALVLSQEKNLRIRQEAEELISSAERHIKHCYSTEPENFQLLPLLRSEWPIWWLTHSVFQHLYPEGPADPKPVDLSTPAPAPLDACWELDGQAKLCPLNKAAWMAVNGVYLLDDQHLQGMAPGLQSSRILQLFCDGRPLHRRATGEALLESLSASIATAEPSWSSVQWWSKQFVALQDPKFSDPSAGAYSASFIGEKAGMYIEETSAGDPYNAEWLQAYLTAFNRMGLQPHLVRRSEEVRAGVLYFWRINQMFGGGQLAGAPGVGLAVAQHLSAFDVSMGAALWPRPETMQFYQDKIALRDLFTRIGVPAPKSWVVQSLQDLEMLMQRGELKDADFPLVLKHPYAASSRGMMSCATSQEVRSVVGQWLQEHQVPCLLQRQLRIARDMRVTYVGGEIIQGYWRVKAAMNDLSSGSAAGSSLDFDTPLEEIAPFVRSFAAATGIDIGGMDIAFPEDAAEGPVVFEVSPIFDLNPEPPAEWRQRPYREYKQTEDYKKRRAENYALCAQKVVEYALQRRGRLFVDIDNTISDAWKRIRRATIPQWPGHSFDAKAHSPEELAKDSPLPGAQGALASLTRDWEVTYLSARGAAGAFQAASKWLKEHHFPSYGQLVLVRTSSHGHVYKCNPIPLIFSNIYIYI
ncbi:unnamed protein product [Cladocopium goreaui]|uniref:ATP-grasp domain-containing protein n=1 Tax=Cladocopium goreaui TaxID=2562237 RepID=A0A9P1GKE6_9DINO|nr:unnamed protein product [Cladocopium goreaui]